MRRRPEGLGVEGPFPFPLVYPDDGGFTLGRISSIYKRCAPIKNICSYTKDMLQYKRHAPIQKTCSNTKEPPITKYMHLLTRKSHICLFLLDDHGNAFGLIPAIITWKDDHFIQCSFQINFMAPSKRKISRIAFVTRL